MIKTRVVLLVIAVLMVVLLFSLPRTVVDNSPGAMRDQQDNTMMPGDLDSNHETSLSEDQSREIERLRELLFINANTEKSSIFADSLAIAFKRANFYDSAAYYYGKLSEMNPGIENWLKAADAYYDAFGFAMEAGKRNRLSAESRAYYQKVIDSEDGNLDVKAKMAMTYVSSENPMQGITLLREVLAEDPENEAAIFNLGLLSITSGQYDRAIERFEQAIRVNPKNVESVFYLGYSHMEAGNKKEAIEQFEVALQMNPGSQMKVAIENYIEVLK